MLNQDYNPIADFSDTEKFNQTLIELRNIVTELEFKREELNDNIDSLTASLKSFALLAPHVVNK
jgi:exonuclease VII small subunit